MTDFPWYVSYPAGVPHTIDPDSYPNVPSVLDEAAKKFPRRTGYSNLGADLTYRQAEQLSKDFAAYLQSLPDMKPGDRVAIMMPNLLQYVIAVFGILRAGMVVVNINPLYTSREVAHTLSDSGAKAIVIIENFARTVEKACPGSALKHFITTGAGDMLPFPKRQVVNFLIRNVKKMVPAYKLPNEINFRDALAAGHSAGFKPVEVTNDSLAFLQYTGGTTGVAKGAELTHRNIVSNILQVSAWISGAFQEGKETVLTALPLYHVFSLTATLVFTKWAAEMVLITNPRNMDSLAKECIKHDVSAIIGVNTLFAALLRNKVFTGHKFKRLKFTCGGGAQVQKVVAEGWLKQTGCPILEAYGLTECSPAVCGNIPGAPWDGSVGVPISSTEVSIRGEGFRDLGQCPEGEDPTPYTGEICVKGPQVMRGYWKKPEETAATMRDGWLRTGDVGHMDHRGVISITDRKKDMIIVSGFNVYPNEVENVIAAMPGVLEVGVTGVSSAKSGETVKAVIVKKDPALTEEDVKQWCRKELTRYKCPHVIVFVDSLPKTPVGKILRRELKDL
ncbi:AMP-binding protein [Sutterella sp.]|uniref:AMP-binding protein n=1 Tax=Sutterella sp. TaxID=1981025 RepID=UPI0026DFE3B3|nr:AMP-binding protein [Sutterella sp.]MDO5532940.1 AMP-binding protein [Sutterella sp.]